MTTRGDQYQGKLQIGQRVYCGLYGGKWGVVRSITGDQAPQSIRSLGGGVVTGGRAMIGVAFDDHTPTVPEGIVRGVQWNISDEIVGQEEIQATITKAAQATAEKRRQEEERKVRQAQRRAELPAEYPHLSPDLKPYGTNYALGSKNLKVELKRAFPSVKFRVTSEGYSGGCSIDVKWTDGPLRADVELIADKYQQGNFDGMTDSYDYDHSNVWPDVFGGAKYVNCQRAVSVPHIIRAVRETYGATLTPEQFDQWGQVRGASMDEQERINRAALALAGV